MKKRSISQLHKAVWNKIREEYREKGNICFTCGKECYGMGRHIGHGLNKASLPLKYKYDKRNLRVQCWNCNLNLGGNQHIFIAKLEKEKEGLEFLKEACNNVDGVWYIKKENDLKFDSREFLESLLSK